MAAVLNPNAVCFYPAAKVSKNSGWINCIQLPPFHFYVDKDSYSFTGDHIIPLNKKEFALFDGVSLLSCDKADYYIYKYNVDKNEWIKWIKAQSEWAHSAYFSFGFDQRNQKLYILSGKTMFKIDINSKKVLTVKDIDVEAHYSGLFINGELHVIGDNEQLIWNDIENVFDGRFAINDEILALRAKWFHLKSRNTVLCLEYSYFNNNTNVYLCDIKQRKYKFVKEIDNVTTLMSAKCSALSIDEKVVVLTGIGVGNKWNIETMQWNIYILNIETMQCKKSKIVSPATNDFVCVCLNGNVMELECLVFGYIRSIWKLTEFCDNKFVPDSVIRLMALFVLLEYVHIVEVRTGNHWKIRLLTIFENLE